MNNINQLRDGLTDLPDKIKAMQAAVLSLSASLVKQMIPIGQ
jgi:hypothetical protein